MPRALDTIAVHAGIPRVQGAVCTPIFQTANYEMAGETDYHALRYIRLNNTPNQAAVAAKIAALEGAEAGLAAASGMAAISTTLLSLLQAGDHALAQRSLYGGTASFLANEAPRLGIGTAFVDVSRPDTWAAALRPQTKVFYVESIANPLATVGELPEVVRFARERGLVSVIDSTFASPVNFRPLEHGFDLVIHSATKYLNGHSDIVAGAVAGDAARVEAVQRRLSLYGGSLDPHSCFLLERGMKTLGVRVRQQNATALALARSLAEHPAVEVVLYPGLPGSPGHAVAAELFSGFGGMLAFQLPSAAAADRAIAALQIPLHAPSLGSVESLVVRPAASTHLSLTAAERAEMGISDGLVRVSVGIEDADDLLADFAQALAAV